MSDTDHWAVTVERSGEKIVTIESNCLAGREISPEDEQTIRTAAHHLLSFIGDRASVAEEVREGWQPVPIVPTREMIDAGCGAFLCKHPPEMRTFGEKITDHYKAMVAAAPEYKQANTGR